MDRSAWFDGDGGAQRFILCMPAALAGASISLVRSRYDDRSY